MLCCGKTTGKGKVALYCVIVVMCYVPEAAGAGRWAHGVSGAARAAAGTIAGQRRTRPLRTVSVSKCFLS